MTAGKDTRGSAKRGAGPRRIGTKRRWSGVIGLGLLLLTLGVMATLAVSTISLKAANARDEIETRLADLSGLDVVVDGDASFSLLPRARITMTDIRIGSGGGRDATLQIDAIVAELGLWPALFGRTEVKRLSVIRPELLSTASFMRESTGGPRQERDRKPSLGSPRLAKLEAAVALPPTSRERYVETSRFFGAFLSRFGELDALEIRDGVFRLDPSGASFGISNANILVSWPSKTAGASLSGSYVWNGQPTEVDLRLASPIDFLEGGPSDIDLSMSSPPLTVSFDGEGATGGIGRFSGILKVGTPSLSRSIRWLVDPRAVLPDIGAVSIEATLDGIGRNLALREATVTLDGFTGQGAVEMLMPAGGKPALGGTLAFERLDLSGFAEAIAPFPTTPFDLQRRISVDFVDRLDLDLRLSAAAGGIGALSFGDLAAIVKFKNGVATFDVGDASLLGGRGQARLSVDSRARSPRATGFASVTGIDSAGLFSAFGVSSIGMSGRSDISAEIDAPVSNWADLFQRNRMRLDISARSGALSGFDPAVFLGEGTRPFVIATRATTVPFQSLRAKLSTVGPRVDLDEMTLTGNAGAFEASGMLSTTTNRIDVTGSYTPEAASRSATAGADPALGTSKPIGFRMSGEWPRPNVTSGPTGRPI